VIKNKKSNPFLRLKVRKSKKVKKMKIACMPKS